MTSNILVASQLVALERRLDLQDAVISHLTAKTNRVEANVAQLKPDESNDFDPLADAIDRVVRIIDSIDIRTVNCSVREREETRSVLQRIKDALCGR